MPIKTNNKVAYDCKYHVVWCSKYRRHVLNEPVDGRLKEIIHSACLAKKSNIIELEVMPDHVHRLVECDPQLGIHRLIKACKGASSRDLRQEFPS